MIPIYDKVNDNFALVDDEAGESVAMYIEELKIAAAKYIKAKARKGISAHLGCVNLFLRKGESYKSRRVSKVCNLHQVRLTLQAVMWECNSHLTEIRRRQLLVCGSKYWTFGPVIERYANRTITDPDDAARDVRNRRLLINSYVALTEHLMGEAGLLLELNERARRWVPRKTFAGIVWDKMDASYLNEFLPGNAVRSKDMIRRKAT